MKTYSLKTVFVIDATFKRTLKNQLTTNHWLAMKPKVATETYAVVTGYLEGTPEYRGKIEKAKELIDTLSNVFPEHSSHFMSAFSFLYKKMSAADTIEKRKMYGKGIASMLYAFCDYINGLSK